MLPIRVNPTEADRAIAAAIAHDATPAEERVGSALTWGADEHVLIAAAAAYWLWSRRRTARERRAGTHFLATSIATGVLPHLLRYGSDQRRPDRLTAVGHLHGVPISGRAEDAFPSGHAMHMGELASAACALPPSARGIGWSVALGLSLTRIVVLAHWTTDVIAGFAGGFALERAMRRLTGYPCETPRR